jgi:phosphoenolpyruvate carboxykinase (GTP)
MPKPNDIDISGLKISKEHLNTLLSVDKEGWKNDVKELKEYYKIFGKKLPKELKNNLESLEKRLN